MATIATAEDDASIALHVDQCPLDLPSVRTVRAAGVTGRLQEATLFHVELEVAGHRFEHLEVLSTQRPYAIIGRNVLQWFVVRLDGPKAHLTVNLPKNHRARRK